LELENEEEENVYISILVRVLCLLQNTRERSFKEERFILAHSFSPWSLGSIVFGPGIGRTLWQQDMVGRAAHIMAAGKERERERERLRESQK
jgi:hypothetical protein